MKYLAIVILAMLATPAQADYIYTAPNGAQIGASCYNGAYGYKCRTWQTGNIFDAPRAAPAIDLTPNTDPEWGKNCRSCYDASKK